MNVARGPAILTLVALAAVLWGGQYVRRGLWEPDEARYAYVAREMRDGGSWIVPHLHGEPYPDKPPLMFWLSNAAGAVVGTGINRITARLPTLLGAVLALGSTAWLARHWAGAAAAWRSVLVLMTSWLFWYEGGWGRIDMLLLGFVMMSLAAFVAASDSRTRGGHLWAYVFAGLAVLTKGPVGLLVPMGIHASMMAATAEPAWWRRSHWVWGPLLAIALPGAWLLAAWWQDAPPDYFAAMLGPKSFGRAIEAVDHGRPFYYYLGHFPMEFLPWTFLLPPAWIALGPGRLRRMLTAWFAFVLLVFSLLATKRGPYILAAYPAAALLVGIGWDQPAVRRGRGSRLVLGTMTGITGLAGIAEIAAAVAPQWPVDRWVLWAAAAVMLTGTLLMLRAWRVEGWGRRWFVAFTATWFVHAITLGTVVAPAFNTLKAPVNVAAEARDWLPAGQPVFLYRAQLAIVPLYAQRPGRLLRRESDLRQILAERARGIVVFTRSDWENLTAALRMRFSAREISVGSKRLVWAQFANAAPDKTDG